jgi:hypothetical protein
VANADTSLWIPETDPEPISAGIVGVGNDGRTTWALQQGSATGTFTDQDNGPPIGTGESGIVEVGHSESLIFDFSNTC